MSDILIKNMEKPKACFRPLCRDFCYFHVTGWDGRGNYCQLTGNKVKCNKIDRDCPIVEVKEVKFKNSDDALKLYADEKKIWTEASE